MNRTDDDAKTIMELEQEIERLARELKYERSERLKLADWVPEMQQRIEELELEAIGAGMKIEELEDEMSSEAIHAMQVHIEELDAALAKIENGADNIGWAPAAKIAKKARAAKKTLDQ